jgi:hypothetical protein
MVQLYLQNDPACLPKLGPRDHPVETADGVTVNFAKEVIEIANALHRDSKVPHKEEVISMGSKLPDRTPPAQTAIESLTTPALTPTPTPTPPAQPEPRPVSTIPEDGVAPIATLDCGIDITATQDQAGGPALNPGNEAISSITNGDTQIPSSTPRMIVLNEIDLSANTESRPQNTEVVDEYVQAWERKVQFPAVIVYQEGDKYYLADGFHRVTAAIKAGLTEIQADVFHGGRLEALEKSLGCNQIHGQRRTTSDKAYAVMKAFREFSDRSDRAIATMCGVSPNFVGKCRNAIPKKTTVLEDSSNDAESNKRMGLDGKKRRLPKKPSTAPGAQMPPEDVKGTHHSEQDESAKDRGKTELEKDHSNGDSKVTGPMPPEFDKVQKNFDPRTRWQMFRVILDQEYAKWPEDCRTIFRQNISACVDDWKEKDQPSAPSTGLNQKAKEDDAAIG